MELRDSRRLPNSVDDEETCIYIKVSLLFEDFAYLPSITVGITFPHTDPQFEYYYQTERLSLLSRFDDDAVVCPLFEAQVL